jgi:mRNA-degrading endonuclease RelE of RelBE toxin-antitoxin system
MLSLVYTRRALKDLAALSAADDRRVKERLAAYAASPDAAGQDVKPVKRNPRGFRMRSGDWRALFTAGEALRQVLAPAKPSIHRAASFFILS